MSTIVVGVVSVVWVGVVGSVLVVGSVFVGVVVGIHALGLCGGGSWHRSGRNGRNGRNSGVNCGVGVGCGSRL